MDKYKTYKNKLTNIIRYTKRQCYHDKFELAKILNFKFSGIAISETWVNDNNNNNK